MLEDKEHKCQELNELKKLNIKKLKNKIKKYNKNLWKNSEKIKKLDIENRYKNIYNRKKELINYIIALINSYDLYINYYKNPSYILYLNISLLFTFIYNNKKAQIYCINYEKESLKIKNNDDKPYDSKIYKRFEFVNKIFCGLQKDENGDLNYIYYDIDNRLIIFFNLETWEYIKEIN